MASQQEGGGRNLFPTFGWSTRSPFSRRGLAFVFLSVVCYVWFFALIAYVCCWHVLFVCLFFFLLSLVFACKTLVFDPGVRGNVVGLPVCPWSCVLLVLRPALSVLFVFVAMRCVVFVSLSFACVARLSCLLFVLGVRGGFSFLLRDCFCLERVCEHRRLPQHLA